MNGAPLVRESSPQGCPTHHLPPGWKRDLALEHCGLRAAIRPGLVLGEANRFLVIQDPISGERHTLTNAQAAVLLRSNGSRSLQTIAKEIVAANSMETNDAEAAVHSILCALIERGLLVLKPDPGVAASLRPSPRR